MKLNRSPRVAFLFTFLLALLFLIGSTSFEAQAASKHARGRAASKKSSRSARSSRGGRRSRGRERVARNGRRGGRMSKRELRAERARLGREQSAYIAKLQRRSGRKLSKRELAAEMRKFQMTHRRALEEARRRAEAARAAAIARQRAIEEAMRNDAESNIAKDSTVGEDLEVRKAAVEASGKSGKSALK